MAYSRRALQSFQLSYIDDLSLTTSSTSLKKNTRALQKEIATLFAKGEQLDIIFDTSKTELIHFTAKKERIERSLILPNNDRIEHKDTVKWLGIYLDNRLSFKSHVSIRVSQARQAFYRLGRLANIELGLSTHAIRQLYLACVTSVSDYGAQIYWQNQPYATKKLQSLHNLACRKTLGVFRTAPTVPTSLEASLLPPAIRLNSTIRNYASRANLLANTHPIAKAITRIQSTNLQRSKKPNQHRQLQTITNAIPKNNKRDTEQTIHTVSQKSKEEEANAHQAYIKTRLDNYTTIYSDASQTQEGKGIGVGIAVYNSTQQEIYSETVNIGQYQLVYNGELEGITRAFEYAAKNATTDQEFEVYADNQAAIYRLKNLSDNPGQHWQLRCLKAANTIRRKQANIHLLWAPGHTDIVGNERADYLAKEATKEDPRSTTKSIAYLGTTIKRIQQTEQRQEYEKYKARATALNKATYSAKYPLKISKTIQMPQNTKRVTSSAFYSLKLGHGYFNSYLKRFKKRDSNRCTCQNIQTPEHLLLYCHLYKDHRKTLLQTIKHRPVTLPLLLHTSIGIEATLAFITSTRIGTRKWYLGQPPEDLQRDTETLGAAVSQATTFESQFFESQTEEEGAAEGSQAGTAATTEASVDTEPDNGDNFDGINWDRLPRFMKPLTTGRRVKSWIFQHGYRVVELYDQNRVWFVCKYCHIHKVIDTGGSGVFDVSKATSSAAAHLGLQKRGHGFTKDGLKPRRTGQQLSLRQTLETGVAVSQEAANAMGNFNIQQFREVAVFCLLDNNLPMELLARPSFREMISLANPEAEAALWVSPRSVATYAMRLFQYMQPQIVCALSEAASKIHISFDGWTTKGGKRGFFGVVAHFANASGVIQDLPIALPHLAGSHTGDAIADTIKKTLQEYSIGSDKLGYFVLDNAANNDTAVSSLAHAYDFNAAHRRLRCGPHTLNLIGQAIIFGSNQEAYNNNNDEQLQTEEVYMQEWRQEGPLGVLIDVINHIKTPQQHEIFRSFQTAANAELPARERLHVLEPVKPVVTRWNSYYAAFKRATQLQAAYNSYAEHYINALSLEDRRACQRGNKLPEAPSWMRSTGLTAADWAVITEYQDCLEPLKLATEKLEGRGKAGKYGAIYETIPVFEYVLGALEARTRSYEQVDFNPPDAPEDHLFVNLRAAWSKANDYYNKLDRSPAYYAATCLHPYYKYYCENSWVDKPEWLTSANAGFLQLWQSYKPQRTRPLSQTTAKPRHRGIDDVIGALVRRNKAQVEAAHDDEYERWRTQEPEWTSEQYLSDGHPVKYWIQLRSKYPCLSQFAIDILTIPASSCDCERLFSELGDLLEPRRRALGSELLAALQLVRSWRRAGFDGLYNNGDDEDKWSDVKDEEIVQQYDIEGWSTTP
ncbi:Dimer-Tnp-hAT domain containing protein [Pyrenophora tritici-repentis]|uniref:Dimer-Tnp-hAT domain containing protein n=4 Tax=Pyrenophora tritici-repentis TaxID=45151 RepID=A0A834RQN2_9PLEO|nr:Dimer-Tnp-hAT domain containing protein [Pyrenophora tritici-repentis]